MLQIDIAKEVHWVTAIDSDGMARLDRRLLNTPADLAELVGEARQPRRQRSYRP